MQKCVCEEVFSFLGLAQLENERRRLDGDLAKLDKRHGELTLELEAMRKSRDDRMMALGKHDRFYDEPGAAAKV